ncbi:MAG: PSD1 and planctomycete cytochrome C domain-containing protein [Cyclobacteriaceae bacterium]|nr:PSD1 and planctomycete cytochrome C domain-containing protein [Cyclobacteriaceae bacterium]
MRYLLLLLPLAVFTISCDLNKSDGQVMFNESIRPIFTKRCMGCHGGVKKLGGFSILTREEALGSTDSGEPAIVPGDADKSNLMRLLTHHDPEERMPQEGSPLTDEEIDLVRKWINEGANWQEHWAFIPPEMPEVPSIRSGHAQNEIDYFIAEKLAEADLELQTEENKATLLRRVALDLTGLPPEKELAEAYLNDNSDDAYEKVVDQLLASPRYGEHLTSLWLDLARYADSKGYEADRHREIWKYRDWVIESFNRDLPFDQFTVQQLAGDLLEDSTEANIIATAFHRNTMNNDEGGTDDEEFRNAAIIDRVNTTWDTWLGITFSCVQCHSHPYEPIKHEEYYEFFAFLNNTADADKNDESPVIQVYTKEQEKTLQDLNQWIAAYDPDTHSLDELMAARDSIEKIKPSTLPVMRELENENRRKTFLFERGNWMAKGQEVDTGIPSVVSIEGIPYDTRLDMARWVVDKKNPLTARVTANRLWGMLFGRGIVETQEDFGSQGIPPTHPELLDWLAVKFSGDLQWSVKNFLKMVVMSGTYRQSNIITPQALAADPYNQLLSRGPRVRLSAEQVRDQALAVSGLLSKKMFGPSVMPDQPEGVWQAVYNNMQWNTSEGEDKYRRAVYTYWRRTSPYPSMISFDSPSREFCVNRRINTNTPLQALVTLNDSVYFEAAGALAVKMKEASNVPGEQIAAGFEMALFKKPDERTMGHLMELYKALEGEVFKPVSLPRENPEKELPVTDALTLVANAIMNLDEFLNK